MRTIPLLVGLLLATALVSFVPAAEAGPVCTSLKSTGCHGIVCVNDVCGGDNCQFQSDCCPPNSLWCPENPDS